MNFRLGKSLVIGAMLISIGGCGDSTGLTTEDLEGTWNATAIVFTNNADSVESADIVQADGASFTMTVSASGSVSTLFDDGQGSTDSDSGTLSSDGSSITIGGDTFQAVRSGDQLTLTNANESYDFGSSPDVPATLVVSLTRQ